MNIKLMIVFMMIAGIAYGQIQGQSSSLFSKSEQTYRDQAIRGSQIGDTSEMYDNSMINGSPRVNASSVSWTIVEKTEVKGVNVHDLVTITIREKSTHGTQADSKSSKDAGINMTLSDWLSLSGGDLKPATMSSGDLKIGASYSRDLDGKSEITREDYLTAQIQAEVVDVYPNGNVMLEATHYIRTDDETTTITLTGICRSNDISASNIIVSDRIANLKINKQHSGIARDYTNRGWLTAVVDFINPF